MTPRATSAGSTSAALPTRPTERAAPVARPVATSVERLVERRRRLRRDTASASRRSMRCGSTSTHEDRGAVHRRRQRLGAAHAAEAGGDDESGRSAMPPKCRARQRRRTSRRCPAGCPACRCRSSCRPSSGRTSSGPCARGRETSPSVAQCGTSSALAISTRGASACVRKTPTGLPDCTSSVSSFSSVAQRRRRWRRTPPSCAPPARCRRRRRDRRAARPPRGRGCSSACAARLPAASPCSESVVPRGARMMRVPAVMVQRTWMRVTREG